MAKRLKGRCRAFSAALRPFCRDVLRKLHRQRLSLAIPAALCGPLTGATRFG